MPEVDPGGYGSHDDDLGGGSGVGSSAGGGGGGGGVDSGRIMDAIIRGRNQTTVGAIIPFTQTSIAPSP